MWWEFTIIAKSLRKWGVTGPWLGIGFGLERLAMVKEGGQNVRSMGKSLSYLYGVRLNI